MNLKLELLDLSEAYTHARARLHIQYIHNVGIFFLFPAFPQFSTILYSAFTSRKSRNNMIKGIRKRKQNKEIVLTNKQTERETDEINHKRRCNSRYSVDSRLTRRKIDKIKQFQLIPVEENN